MTTRADDTFDWLENEGFTSGTLADRQLAYLNSVVPDRNEPYEFDWTGAADSSGSIAVKNNTIVGRNLIPNPKLVNNITGWSATNGNASFPDNTYTRITATADVAAANFRLIKNAPRMAITPGKGYVLSAESRGSKPSVCIFSWFDANSQYITASFGAPFSGSGSWVRGFVGAFAPPNARYVDLLLANSVAAVVGDTYDWRAARLCESTDIIPTLYFDGDTADLPDIKSGKNHTSADMQVFSGVRPRDVLYKEEW